MEWLSGLIFRTTGMTLPIVTAKFGLPQAREPRRLASWEACSQLTRELRVRERLLHEIVQLSNSLSSRCFPSQMGLLPISTDIRIRYGAAVDVGEPESDPSDARVEEVFARYLKELQRVFDSNAAACLPAAVAKRGLKVVRL